MIQTGKSGIKLNALFKQEGEARIKNSLNKPELITCISHGRWAGTRTPLMKVQRAVKTVHEKKEQGTWVAYRASW